MFHGKFVVMIDAGVQPFSDKLFQFPSAENFHPGEKKNHPLAIHADFDY